MTKLWIEILQVDGRVGPGVFVDWLEELGVASRYWDCSQGELPATADIAPIILLGGYMGVHDMERLPYLKSVVEWLRLEVERGRPVLAICLGGQLLAQALGGQVYRQQRSEKGVCDIFLTVAGENDPLFDNLPNPFSSFLWHNDSFDPPIAATLLAQTKVCPGQVFRYCNAWGVQFHPEVDDRIVADWCLLAGAGDEPLVEFLRHQESYFRHSMQILANYIAAAKRLSPGELSDS